MSEELIGSDWQLPPPAIAEVSIEDVSVLISREHLLYRINAAVNEPSVVAILGANGAGKTTLLRVMATLLEPHSGRVLYGGTLDSRKHRDQVRAHIGVVAHQPMMQLALTVAENLELAAELRGLNRREAHRWADELGLQPHLHKPASQLSRGLLQRLSLARAMLHSPSVLLFDEPLTGLDAASQEHFWQTTRALRAAGRIVFVITHQLDAPTGAVDRLLLLRRGRLVHDRPIESSLAATAAPLLAAGAR